ncbi:hypothetical protein C5O79_05210 [Burkholderia sp. SRS-25]|nr:hypothetical protein C5O79_05210 [Burkholderia sp. SRS-25]
MHKRNFNLICRFPLFIVNRILRFGCQACPAGCESHVFVLEMRNFIERPIMNLKLKLLALSLAVLSPVASFAQSDNAPLTRAQVRAQLIQIEKAGYFPQRKDPNYPDALLAAERRISLERTGSGVGSDPANQTASGQHVWKSDESQLYRHH